MARPTIFEFAGGDAAFLALAAAHHERCLQDPEISHAFSNGFNPAHVENLAFYWVEVFGGPARYSELHGGHPGMLEIHARTGAAEEVMPYSPPESQVPKGLPVPRWGWNGPE